MLKLHADNTSDPKEKPRHPESPHREFARVICLLCQLPPTFISRLRRELLREFPWLKDDSNP